MNIADIVISLNGRDAGKRFCVIDVIDGYSFIADGRGRRYEKPKKKKHKHLKYECRAGEKITQTLVNGGKVTNNELRRELAAIAEKRDAKKNPANKQGASEEKGGVPKCRKTT